MAIEDWKDRMEDLKSEIRVVQKNRLCWTLTFLGAIIIGVLFFTLSVPFNSTAIFSTIFVVTLVYTTLSELATKTVDTFFRRSILIFPLGSVFAYILNYLSRKYVYTIDDPYGLNFTFYVYVVLLAICVLSSGIGTLITRLTSGYEALAEEPVVVSYSIKSSVENVTASLEGFLESLNIEYTTAIRKNQRFFKFDHSQNQYFLFQYSIDNDHVEIDLVVLRWKRETILEPKKEDLKIFLGYLESYLNREKEENRLGEWTSNFKPTNAEISKTQVWSNLTSAFRIRERLALRGVLTQRIISVFKAHKVRIVDVIVSVAIIIVGEFILRYVLHWI
jgi:hypothetical protein